MYMYVSVVCLLVFQVDQGFFQAWGGGVPSKVFCFLENKVVRLSNFTIFEKKNCFNTSYKVKSNKSPNGIRT